MFYFFPFPTGSRQERGSSPLPGHRVAAAVQCAEHAHQGPVLRAAEDDVAVREADSPRHRPHVSRARVLQGEGQFGPGGAFQRHEGEPSFGCEGFSTNRSPRVDSVIAACADTETRAITVTSGVFSGRPRGRLLSRECLHCGTAAHAGNASI